jgi:soluble lytic murein transglycosylase
MTGKILKLTIFIMSIILTISMILPMLSCSKINLEKLGLKTGEDAGNSKPETESEDTSLPQKNDSNTQDISTDPISTDSTDINKLRKYYKEAIKYFDQESYLIAEYYFNKIKYGYLLLQDHIFYYLAKCLMFQGKYEQSEEHYLRLIENYPDSVWSEKANLEYADLFYLKKDYATAEIEYQYFLSNFPDSEDVPYCLFQLASCQENNDKLEQSFDNYKKIWLYYPLNEYSETAWESLNRIAEYGIIEPFVPTARQVYKRAEIFFSSYDYESALEELNKILEGEYMDDLLRGLHSEVLFKKGMCYYNHGDYDQAKDYLIQSYEKHPSGLVADDSLFFLGRALTNLDDTNGAISYYQKLLNLFPGSNDYCHKALYEIGEIYFLRKDLANAISYFQKVLSDYPDGNKLSDTLWKLGWMQYRSADYSSAIATFSDYASSFEGTSLEEKGLFWQAKCHQKLGENGKAATLYLKIINLNSYSYYTFKSRDLLSEMDIKAQIKEIDTGLDPENPQIADVIPDIYASIEEDSYFQDGQINHTNKAIELYQLEFYNSADLEIEAAESEIEQDPSGILKIATLFLKSKDYAGSIKIIQKNLKNLKSELDKPHMDYLYYLYYPYGYKEIVQNYSNQYAIDPLLTLAVIRQESHFMPLAGSYMGAQGLMQIMPPTGEEIARRIGVSNYDVSMLLDPEINIKMGTNHLSYLMDIFQNQIYSLGAYNGGQGKMSEWISKRGSMDIYEFIENLSFETPDEYEGYEQTRDYIKKVMGNYYFYQMLYD